MAAPPSITIHSLSGAYDLNKTLSDSTGAMLKMQNIGFLVRQAANYSAITVHLSQYPFPEDANVVQVDQEQISTGNMKQYEPRILDGEVREREIQYWGKVRGWNKYVKLSEITQDAWLTEGWDPECSSEQGQVLLSFTESVGNGWMACQVWGFATVDGVRRHVRRIYSKKGKEEHRVRLVYDYKGDVPAATS
ncbi:uncharacterized protein SEPMUDRAFT_148975 [Sphaerulina musiva SO2202]|uniref:Uncharacterized protein n=1 Tax=Sphaerulina musiva (strain SO2202) TaxID=692275 RepID=M3D7E2_SPHMS|nr:uncharacterized protein SEPMUDRAFT_148975 [Sphaerulina musiva SO2202]EMF13794.1 hypothetical protein SEPMUDRAFT_148975 [Sphaerulina musiva SO2202]